MSIASDRMKTTEKEAQELSAQFETLRSDLTDLTDTVSRLAKAGYSDAKGVVQEQAGEATQAARRQAGELEATVRENPLQAALIAAGVGFAIGLMARR